MYEEHVDELGFWYQKHFNNAIRCIANYTFRTSVLKDKGGFVDFPLATFSDDATVLLIAKNGVANTKGMLLGFRESIANISGRKLNNLECYQKALATLMYDKWFNEQFLQIHNLYHSSLLWGRCYWLIKLEHETYRNGLFATTSLKCTFSDYVKLLRFIPSFKKKIKIALSILYC